MIEYLLFIPGMWLPYRTDAQPLRSAGEAGRGANGNKITRETMTRLYGSGYEARMPSM